MAWLFLWARLLFMWPTHRFFRLGDGVYCQAKRGVSDAEIAAILAAYARNVKGRT
jgi:hypothetical protein